MARALQHGVYIDLMPRKHICESREDARLVRDFEAYVVPGFEVAAHLQLAGTPHIISVRSVVPIARNPDKIRHDRNRGWISACAEAGEYSFSAEVASGDAQGLASAHACERRALSNQRRSHSSKQSFLMKLCARNLTYRAAQVVRVVEVDFLDFAHAVLRY